MFFRKRGLVIAGLLSSALAVALVEWREERMKRVELEHFVDDSCEALASELEYDVEEIERATRDDEVARLERQFMRSSTERARLADRCIGSPVSLECFPPVLSPSTTSKVRRAAASVRARACLN